MTMIDNRYKIIKKLGAGAMGIVYKVIDLRNKHILALKLLSAEKASSEAVQHFKREFRLLATLHHPSLCAVYDFGTRNDGRSYFTMEYIEGKDIFRAVRGLPYEKIYPWVVQLCRVLEYIHAKGLIHYDIKPGNVMIHMHENRLDGAVVKLMDFGLAGEQQIKGGLSVRGTLPYIAPEVIEGLAVDQRADLYSLGVLLYELFTRRSFQVEDKESFVTLLKQRMQKISASPSRIVADIPKGLAKVLVRLIAFEPSERYSRANEVIQEINKISGRNFDLETEKTVEGYLLSSRFVGRDKEMSILQSLYEQARQGNGSVVLAIGDAGIGKSRLLKEFKLFTQLARGHCFTGYAHRDKTGLLEPFYDILKELINHLKGMVLSSEIKFSLTVLFKIFPGLADGYLRRGLPRLVPLGPQQEKLRILEALTALIRHCVCGFNGLVILLEDLHWADELTIQFLDYLARNISDRGVFILGTVRSEELKKHVILQQMISNLRQENFHRLELKPLNLRGLHAFLDSTITPYANSVELTHYLMDKTRGNPFFVEEIMRTLLRKKGLSIGEKLAIADFKKIAIPERIEEVVLKRIFDLDHNCQEVIRYAAVLLKDFNYDLMKRLTGLDDTELSRALWELRKNQILIEEDNIFKFYHATLGEVVKKQLGYQEKKRLFHLVGSTVASVHQARIESVIDDLAYYFINARDRKWGVRYGLQAAKYCGERYAYEQAVELYKDVLKLLDRRDHRQQFDILGELTKMEGLVGFVEEAIKHYHKAFRLKVGPVDTVVKFYIRIGVLYVLKGEYKKALRCYRQALGFAKAVKSTRLKAVYEILSNLKICNVFLQMGNYKNADSYSSPNLQFLKNVKDKDMLVWKGILYQHLGDLESRKSEYAVSPDYDKAIYYLKEAYKCQRITKQIYEMGTVISGLGVIAYNHKFDYPKALHYFKRALRLDERIRDTYGCATTLCNIGVVLGDEGYYLRALEYLKKGLFISERIKNPYITRGALLALGACCLKLCEYKKADEYLEKALKISVSTGSRESKILPMITIGQVFQQKGDYDSAFRLYRRALKLSIDINHQRHQADAYVAINSIFIELGEFLEAARYAKDALNIAQATGLMNVELECYIVLCIINILVGNYDDVKNYYCKGLKLVKKIIMRREQLRLYLIGSKIYEGETKFSQAFRTANKAIKLAEKIAAKDLQVEALLGKAKNGIKSCILSEIEVAKIYEEARKIAEDVDCPEVLWKVYFEYGEFLKGIKDYKHALDYYNKCHEVFKEVGGRIKNESYRRSYINRPDRQAVFRAIDEIERLVNQ